MKTLKAFKEEFPELSHHDAQTAYHYLEIACPKAGKDKAFRQAAVASIDSNGNMLKSPPEIAKELIAQSRQADVNNPV